MQSNTVILRISCEYQFINHETGVVMKSKINHVIVSVFALVLFTELYTFAGDDKNIKGELRKGIKSSMGEYIDGNTIDSKFKLFDPIEGKVLDLKLDHLHEGIVKKGDYYVSCADFVDQEGRKIDIDLFVLKDGKNLKTVQAIVHSVDGEKRKYHLEEAK